MILYYQTHSPFARKALVFAHEAGIADRLEVIHHETSPTLRNARVYAENPLGKVPVLLRPNASPIFDSDVICAYLDTLHDGRKLLPQDGEARWQALRLQSVAQASRRQASLCAGRQKGDPKSCAMVLSPTDTGKRSRRATTGSKARWTTRHRSMSATSPWPPRCPGWRSATCRLFARGRG